MIPLLFTKVKQRKMPKLMLVVSAELVNIVFLELRPIEEEISYYFKLECEGCGWVSKHESCIRMHVREDPLRQRRGALRLNVECEECKRYGHIELVPGHGHHLEKNHCTDVPLMLFDCHGILPLLYCFSGGWSAITTSGRRIINIDLGCGVYEAEIDGERVAIRYVEAKFLPFSG